MKTLLLVMLGSGIGGGARHLVTQWSVKIAGDAFPYGTIAINVVGSFLMVVVVALSAKTAHVSPDARMFLTTGVMGGFTTYSAFNYQVLKSFEDGAVAMGVVNIAATFVLCLLAGALGLVAVRFVTGGLG